MICLSETMRALVKHHEGYGARVEEVPVPQVRDNEVLIRIKNTSICGTDVHIYTWDDWAKSRVKPPYICGHELSGEVVEIGKNVTSIRVGDHVSAESHLVCGVCAACRRGDEHVCYNTRIIGVDCNGCFAEYISLPEVNCWKNSKELPFEIATLMEPMGNAVHTVLSGEVLGKSVAVIGCGPIGVMAVAIAKAAGASKVIAIEPSQFRLELASKMGAHYCIPSNEDVCAVIKEITNGEGVNVVCEMSGHPKGIEQGFNMLSLGCRMSILGLPTHPVEIDITNHVVFKGVQIHGIAGRRLYQTWEQTAALLESGLVNLEPLITHRFPMTNFKEGFDLMQRGECGKVVFHID